LGKTKEIPLIDSQTVVKDFFPTYLMVGVIVLLILASFLPNKPNETNGFICVGLMLIGTLQKAIVSRDKKVFASTFKAVDYFTLLLLAGLFIVIQSLNNAGVITAIGQLISTVASGNVFIAYTIIVWVSVLLSAFIDNIPYVLTMLPVAAMIATDLGVSPEVLYFGLLIGATLGGNMTPIGASANITAIGILRKDGFEVKTWDFMRLGIPYTLAAVTSGYLLTWFIWR
jgi:Na+/H+ antiporter NhaD/arsenite permease-like protein